jgi:hypothetical protein
MMADHAHHAEGVVNGNLLIPVVAGTSMVASNAITMTQARRSIKIDEQLHKTTV